MVAVSKTAAKTGYRGERYWEKEKPQIASSPRVMLSYFELAGELQISKAYKDRETGELRRGQTVTLDCEDVQLNPEVRELLERVLRDWE
ncbi:MAG: hypothetical protein AB1374_04540 [Bacillota bacterium]